MCCESNIFWDKLFTVKSWIKLFKLFKLWSLLVIIMSVPFNAFITSLSLFIVEIWHQNHVMFCTFFYIIWYFCTVVIVRYICYASLVSTNKNKNAEGTVLLRKKIIIILSLEYRWSFPLNTPHLFYFIEVPLIRNWPDWHKSCSCLITTFGCLLILKKYVLGQIESNYFQFV